MIEFDEKYFQGGIRDGYYVSSDRKRLWAADLEVLMEIDRICKKHKIPYFAAYGTLLGAVRHNGFIPWDDDMDIIMFRKDYMRFLSLVKEEVASPFVCGNIYHMKNWETSIASITNSRSRVNISPDFLKRFHGYPYFAGVDIFVFDNLEDCEDEYYYIAMEKTALLHLRDLLKRLKEIKGKDKAEEEKIAKKIEKSLLEIEKDLGVSVDREKNILNQLMRIMDGLFALCEEEKEEIVEWASIESQEYHCAAQRREWYRESVELPFEGVMIPVPIGFHEALKQIYGADYLAPVKYSHDIEEKNRKVMQGIMGDIFNVQKRMGGLEKIL